MEWNATTIVVFLFFNPHELTRIHTKFYKKLLHQIALLGLANWTKKVFHVFRVTYHTGRDQTVLLHFFSALRHFSEKKFPKGFPFNFFAVLRQNGCWKTPKGPPFSFSALWDFFLKIFSPKGPPLQFFWHCEIFFRKKKFSPSISLIFYNRMVV